MNTIVIIGSLKPFSVGSNAGGGEGVLIERNGVREKVYRYITGSIGGRPRDTTEETSEWRELAAQFPEIAHWVPRP